MTVVASTSGSQNGTASIRLKAESREARSRFGEVGQHSTPRVRLLPDENPREFRERMTGLFDSLRPRNQFEISLVERVFPGRMAARSVHPRGVGSAVPEGPHSRHRRTKSRGGGGSRADDTADAGTLRTTRGVTIRRTTRGAGTQQAGPGVRRCRSSGEYHPRRSRPAGPGASGCSSDGASWRRGSVTKKDWGGKHPSDSRLQVAGNPLVKCDVAVRN